jgi:hypothetical protein
MKRFLIHVGLGLMLLLGSIGETQAFTTIDTTPAWDGTSNISPFGYPNTATYGQVVTVPATDRMLKSFSFYMNLPDTCSFRGYVYAWDGSKATGSALYESNPRATSGSGDFEEITFEPSGLELTPGAQYVLFASTSKDAGSGGGPWGLLENQDLYLGGGKTLVYLNNGDDESLWTVDNWTQNTYGTGVDLAFKATFVEPARRILYWCDSVSGTDYMGEALSNIARTHSISVTTAVDVTDFESKVTLGEWNLVILMIQGDSYDTPNFNAYVSAGGRAIHADCSRDTTRGALFGVSYTGIENETIITITDDLLSVGVTNPVILSNPGWGTFSMGMTDSGIVAATFGNGDAAIVIGNNGKTIINGFLSDTLSSASDGVALFENEIKTVFPLTVTSANGGEGVPTGDVFNIRWIPSRAVSFNIDLSTDNGSTWKPLGKEYGENEFAWRVPLQKNNNKNCLIRVTGFNEHGKKVGTDISDRVFTTEVIKLIFPNGGETWKSGDEHNIIWSTNNTLMDVASVKLYYTQNGGTTWKPIDPPSGNPGSKLWKVPDVTLDKIRCKVKVVLMASDGTSVGNDISDNFFTIASPGTLPDIAVENETGDTSTTSQP